MSAARAFQSAAIGTAEERALARAIALGFLSRLPSVVPREDVLQAALVGLWVGVQRCAGDVSPEQRKGYLITRIRGQILDELRAQDWLPRRSRKAQKDANAPRLRVVRFDDIGRADESHAFEELLPAPGPSPEDLCIRESDVAEAMGAPLTDRQRRVVRGHYWGSRRFSELADEIGISEPRVSQLHAQAINTMRAWQTGDLTEPTLVGPKVRRDARAAIAKKHERKHDHRDLDRGAGSPPSAPARAGAVASAIPVRGLGGPAPAAPHRPGARGARSPELDGATRPGLRDERPAPCPAGAPAEASGGLPVISAASSAEPVPSVLPEEGFNLHVALTEYRDWMIDQALIRAGHNVSLAARLLGWKRTTLAMALRGRGIDAPRGKPGRRPRQSPPAAEVELPAAELAPESESSRPAALADRIPWAEVAAWRASGVKEYQITRVLAQRLGTHRFTIEKALRQPHPLAKCGP